MPRDHVEFLRSSELVSTISTGSSFAGATTKLLSRDEASGAESRIIRLAPDQTISESVWPCNDEIFLLSGGLRLGERDLGPHDYCYMLKGGRAAAQASPKGATFLSYADGIEEEPIGETLVLRTSSLPWDRVGIDSNIDHLHVARKNLRFDPRGRRTYLLGGMPQGMPMPLVGRKERHPHVEEFFVVSGEIACSLVGVMRAGDYFWRPPGIWHGLDSSRAGFLLFCRTPGANATISEWSEETFPIDPDPPYRPVLPACVLARIDPSNDWSGE